MTPSVSQQVVAGLRAIADYPKPGITFRDITPVLQDARLFRQVIEELARPFRNVGVSHVLGIEARGFILGAPVAVALNAGFLPARKPGKLPWQTLREEYALEYGTDALEAHKDACPPGSKILVVDDVLATGGTARAAGRLARALGGSLVGWSLLLELTALGGRSQLEGAPCHAIAAI